MAKKTKHRRKERPWEAQEVEDINRYWRRPIGTREHARQMSTKSVGMREAKRTSSKRSYKS